MAGSGGILILNKNDRQRRVLRHMFRSRDFQVFTTADALEAFHILQKEDIAVFISGSEITGMQKNEFRALVEKIRPGISTVFIPHLSEKQGEFAGEIEDFLKMVADSVAKVNRLSRDLSEMRRFSYSIADRLLQIFVVNDKYFFNNDHLVANLAGNIAIRMGLVEDVVEAIRMAALLRDLGKVVIHQQILEDAKRLSQDELTPIKAHPVHTMQILRQVRFPWNLDSIITQHHEHYDGSGYPLGLKGREISVGARIINVADAYYAMTTDRPYRKALPREKALAEIRKNAGTQFDPEVVEVFLSVSGEEPAEAAVRKSILVFERDRNIAAMVKLGVGSKEVEVQHVTSSIEAISRVRQKNPFLIIADFEALEPETFQRFYRTVRQMAAPGHRFLLIFPDGDAAGRFGEKVDHLVKPLNVEQITAKIRGLLLEPAPPVPQGEVKGLSGRLEDFSLADIVQVLNLGLKTALVEIERDQEKGLLYLKHGGLIHAAVGGLRGPEAFFELVRWGKGSFFIMHGQTTDNVNITLDTAHLLIEACRILDEEKARKPSRPLSSPRSQ